MAEPQVPVLPITACPAGAGSINVPGGEPPPTPANPYVPPSICVGELRLSGTDCSNAESAYQEQLATENLEISGAPLNVFKLLGVHEQGLLIDLTGTGQPMASSGTPADAFDALAPAWTSTEVGTAVTSTPAYIGYDFGVRKTSFGQDENAPGVGDTKHITSIRITHSAVSTTRVRQLRVERSDGGLKIDPAKVLFTGTGNGALGVYTAGVAAKPGLLMLTATSATSFTVTFTSSTGTAILGVATVGTLFNSLQGSFTIQAGSTPFVSGDFFTAPVELDWYRVDVVNVPDVPVALLNIKQSAASRYWRLVPLLFAGSLSGSPWVIEKLELFDFQSTRLDSIQDTLYMENRDRDYANASIQLKAAYTPFDGMQDLSKYGFQVADIWTFTTGFARMVQLLGRPIVVGDVVELPSELQYDHNLRPVRRFLEVKDVGWAGEGFTTAWRPVLYRFTAEQLVPSQEHRDILGTADTQKYVVDDGSFFDGIEQIQTYPLTVTEANHAEAVKAVPEKGVNMREAASGTNRFKQPGSYDGVGPYVQDGLPPDGQPYTEGFKLPDVSGAVDGAFFRLNYDPALALAARLYKFSAVKNSWIFIEQDRRGERTAHTPSQLKILNSSDRRSLRDGV